MTTHDTRSQLLAEIAASPDDDTLRLAFADWLDEHGDAADRDRAEFVRLDVERHRRWPDFARVCEADRPTAYADWQDLAAVEKRILEVGTAHSEWSRCRCPWCDGIGFGGAGQGGHTSGARCVTCYGTGDLFVSPPPSGLEGLPPPVPRTVTFARGFADAVSCTLAEAFAADGTPTPWAVEVVKQTPVVRFIVTDTGPPNADSGDREYPFHWRGTMFTNPAGYTIADMANKNYRTVERAVDAYALAAGLLVRRHAYKERT